MNNLAEPRPEPTTPLADPSLGRLSTVTEFASSLRESIIECDGSVSPRDEALIAECVILYRCLMDRVRDETIASQQVSPGHSILVRLKHAAAIR